MKSQYRSKKEKHNFYPHMKLEWNNYESFNMSRQTLKDDFTLKDKRNKLLFGVYCMKTHLKEKSKERYFIHHIKHKSSCYESFRKS